MKELSTVLKYIEEFYPVEFDNLGEATVINLTQATLSNKNINVVSSKQGSDFDVKETIEFVCIVVQGIAATWQLLKEYKSISKPTTNDIKKQLLEAFPDYQKKVLDTPELVALLEQVIKDFEKK